MMITMSENIRRKLEQINQQLIKELEQHEASGPRAEQASELREPRSDRTVDAATAAELEQKSAVVDNLRARVKMVEHALNKLDAGNYGLCDICGKPISPERLEALPYANLCISCKAGQAKDAKGKRIGK
jgi:DnaK suppressor protein